MKGIIFDAESVHGFQAGIKTMTRRVIEPQPADDIHEAVFPNKKFLGFKSSLKHTCGSQTAHVPRYQPGDILYVKETWDLIPDENGREFYVYKEEQGDSLGIKWRSPMFMPRAAARIFLRVTEVRVEKMQDISEGDARAEGCPRCLGKSTCGGCDPTCEANDPIGWYYRLWDKLNGKRGPKGDRARYSWARNPWVLACRLEPINKKEAEGTK